VRAGLIEPSARHSAIKFGVRRSSSSDGAAGRAGRTQSMAQGEPECIDYAQYIKYITYKGLRRSERPVCTVPVC